MTRRAFPFVSLFGLSILLTAPSSAGSLPEGGFKGSSQLIGRPDVMALFIRKDPKSANAYYAVLAEYDRINGYIVPDRLAITKWVPRMYAYRLVESGERRYSVQPLRVSGTGEIEVDDRRIPDSLSLAKDGTLDGATLVRYRDNSVVVAERIKFKGRISSTWEEYMPGTFFGTSNSSGGDYFKKGVNMTLSKDNSADFRQEDIQGAFAVSEKAPGMYTFRALGTGHLGADKILGRIGVFIDIVNWKPIFTTDELLLINPEQPLDVGFYYERH